MVCWNDDAEKFLDAVLNKGHKCFAHPKSIEKIRAEDAERLFTFDIAPNEWMPEGKLVAIAPLPTIQEIADSFGVPKRVLTAGEQGNYWSAKYDEINWRR